MYVILSRYGYEFGSLGMDYVIRHNGIVIFTDMNKAIVEREFFRLVNATQE